MSRNGEGLGEIRANERRVATSKKAVSLAAKSREAAEAALTKAEDAFKIAEAALKAAQKDTDAARQEEQEAKADMEDAEKCLGEAKKKWEVIDLAEEDTSDVNESNQGAAPNKKARRTEGITLPDEIVVEGCGLPVVNGIYNRCKTFKYSRNEQWDGKDVIFLLRRVNFIYHNMWFFFY
jgi:hypothetical protein